MAGLCGGQYEKPTVEPWLLYTYHRICELACWLTHCSHSSPSLVQWFLDMLIVSSFLHNTRNRSQLELAIFFSIPRNKTFSSLPLLSDRANTHTIVNIHTKPLDAKPHTSHRTLVKGLWNWVQYPEHVSPPFSLMYGNFLLTSTSIYKLDICYIMLYVEFLILTTFARTVIKYNLLHTPQEFQLYRNNWSAQRVHGA